MAFGRINGRPAHLRKITRVLYVYIYIYKKMYVAVLPGRNTEVTVRRDSTVLER